MSAAQVHRNKLVLGLAGIVLFLLALMVPYPLYSTIQEQCFEIEYETPCTPAHKEWILQPPLIMQIYSAIEKKRDATPGPPGSTAPAGLPGEPISVDECNTQADCIPYGSCGNLRCANSVWSASHPYEGPYCKYAVPEFTCECLNNVCALLYR